MMIANQELSAKLYELTKWPSLYWWNWDKKSDDADFSWRVDNHPLGPAIIKESVPAYNFDMLFEKLRAVFASQEDRELLHAFKLMLQVPNPAEALCRLAIGLAEQGLLK